MSNVPPDRTSPTPRWSARVFRGWPALLVIGAFLLPLVIENSFYIHMFNRVYINLILVVSLGLIASAGQLSLCHAAFAGIGAYTSSLAALMFGVSPFIGIPLGAALAGLIALGIGALTLRLRGAYFALVTFLFGQVFYLLAIDAKDITQGANGLVGIPPIQIAGLSLTTPNTYYYVLLPAAVLVLLFVWAILRSPTGRALSSVEQNIVLAEASGIPTRSVQLLAFTIGSALAGLGGGLAAHYIRFVSPESFTVWEAVFFIVMVVVGGRRSLAGWVIGVVFLTPLPELLRETMALQHIIYGAILVAVLMFVPDGLISIASRFVGVSKEPVVRP